MKVPVVPRQPWGIACLVANVVPGVGTLMAAANQEDRRYLAYGAAQLLLSFTVVGLLVTWPWSIVTGVLILLRSERAAPEVEAAKAQGPTGAAGKATATADPAGKGTKARGAAPAATASRTRKA